jgi:hypothetical protein
LEGIERLRAASAQSLPFANPDSPADSEPSLAPDVVAFLTEFGADLSVQVRSAQALRQTLVRRLLEFGRPIDAWALAEAERGVLLTCQQRTRFILRAWHWLTIEAHGGEQTASARQEALRDEFPASQSSTDQIARRWRFLVDSVPYSQTQVAEWKILEPWPLAPLPELWSLDANRRKDAAAAICSTMVNWREDQRLLVKALTCWVRNDWSNYEVHYSAIEPVLSEIPFDPAELWLAAAHHWLRTKNWTQLLDAQLPAELAKKRDPRVGQARVAAGVLAASALMTNDKPLALRRIRQARQILQAICKEKK